MFGKLKAFLTHSNDLIFLITGLNLKGMFTRSKVEKAGGSDSNDNNTVVVMPTVPEEAVTHLLQYEDKPFK